MHRYDTIVTWLLLRSNIINIISITQLLLIFVETIIFNISYNVHIYIFISMSSYIRKKGVDCIVK